MATNWETVTGSELSKVLNLTLISKANQNTDEDAQPANGEVYLDAANRRDDIVAELVSELRSNIEIGGQTPLSVTPSVVPPGAKRHILNIAAWQLLNSTPNLNMAIMTEKGVSMPFAAFYQEGIKYFEAVKNGLRVPAPTDPVGIDGLTAVTDENPAISIFTSGDIGDPDLATDAPWPTS